MNQVAPTRKHAAHSGDLHPMSKNLHGTWLVVDEEWEQREAWYLLLVLTLTLTLYSTYHQAEAHRTPRSLEFVAHSLTRDVLHRLSLSSTWFCL